MSIWTQSSCFVHCRHKGDLGNSGFFLGGGGRGHLERNLRYISAALKPHPSGVSCNDNVRFINKEDKNKIY